MSKLEESLKKRSLKAVEDSARAAEYQSKFQSFESMYQVTRITISKHSLNAALRLFEKEGYKGKYISPDDLKGTEYETADAIEVQVNGGELLLYLQPNPSEQKVIFGSVYGVKFSDKQEIELQDITPETIDQFIYEAFEKTNDGRF